MDRHVDRRRAALAHAGVALTIAIPTAFVGVLFVYPLAAIVAEGLSTDGGVDLDFLRDVLADDGLRRAAWFTVWQAAVSTVLTLVVGIPGAYALTRFRFRGRELVRALVIVPFVLPTVVVGAAFLAVLGPRGPFGLDLSGSVWAIVAAHVFFNYAVVVRTVGASWALLDPATEEAARVLGASRWRAWREVTLPALGPSIRAAAVIVFLFTFTSFGVIRVLGGGRRVTLEYEIYRQTANLFDLRTAAVLSVVQLVAVGALLLGYERMQHATASVRMRREAETAYAPRSVRERGFLLANLALMATLLGVPIAVLIERSFAVAGGHGLASWRALWDGGGRSAAFVDAADAFANSVRFAAVAMVIAVFVGGLAAVAIARRRHARSVRMLDVLLMLPLGTSAVTVGFGFLLALDSPPLDLRGSEWLIPLAQGVIAVPFVVRIVVPVLRGIDPRLREAAAILGASPRQVWREIDLPIALRAFAAAAGFAFAISLGEFGATVFVARADSPTLPIAIARALGRPGALAFGQAMAMSVVLMVVSAVAVLALDRVRAGRLGSF